MNFTDKIVVVTGGSKGLGRALAAEFKKQKSKVIILSDSSDVENTSKEIGADRFYIVDVTNFEKLKNIVEEIISEFGKIDVWVNNAGIQIAPATIEELDLTKARRVLDVNFFGYLHGLKTVLPGMKKLSTGTVININSTAGLGGKPGLSAYVSSKFAVNGLTQTAREELKDSNIDVLQIFPGGIQTDIYNEKVPDDIDQYMKLEYVVEKIFDNLLMDEPEQDLIIKRPTAV